jgi:hypothetical protein
MVAADPRRWVMVAAPVQLDDQHRVVVDRVARDAQHSLADPVGLGDVERLAGEDVVVLEWALGAREQRVVTSSIRSPPAQTLRPSRSDVRYSSVIVVDRPAQRGAARAATAAAADRADRRRMQAVGEVEARRRDAIFGIPPPGGGCDSALFSGDGRLGGHGPGSGVALKPAQGKV